METIFLSYVREDEAIVGRLASELKNRVLVWEEVIRKAISNGTYFVPCFSRHYAARATTYMNEEREVEAGARWLMLALAGIVALALLLAIALA